MIRRTEFLLARKLSLLTKNCLFSKKIYTFRSVNQFFTQKPRHFTHFHNPSNPFSHDDCGYTRNDNLEEIVSLLEQEVVYRSNIFVRSVVSSWSLNVQLQRAVERRDREDVTNWRLLTPDIIGQQSNNNKPEGMVNPG